MFNGAFLISSAAISSLRECFTETKGISCQNYTLSLLSIIANTISIFRAFESCAIDRDLGCTFVEGRGHLVSANIGALVIVLERTLLSI